MNVYYTLAAYLSLFYKWTSARDEKREKREYTNDMAKSGVAFLRFVTSLVVYRAHTPSFQRRSRYRALWTVASLYTGRLKSQAQNVSVYSWKMQFWREKFLSISLCDGARCPPLRLLLGYLTTLTSQRKIVEDFSLENFAIYRVFATGKWIFTTHCRFRCIYNCTSRYILHRARRRARDPRFSILFAAANSNLYLCIHV